MIGFVSLLSVFVALAVGLGLGVLLGRVATEWFTGRALVNLFMEIRGAFLPFLLVPVVAETFRLPSWLTVGLIVGMMQAISVSRWIAHRSGDWTPSMVAGIALGRSRGALLARSTTARGAVVGTLAVTTIQVIVLEVILAALNLPKLGSADAIGARLYHGSGIEILFVLVVGTGAIVLCEVVSAWALQRRPGTSKK